nr:hypothetical protein [Tanacetum cinerariifolium]
SGRWAAGRCSDYRPRKCHPMETAGPAPPSRVACRPASPGSSSPALYNRRREPLGLAGPLPPCWRELRYRVGICYIQLRREGYRGISLRLAAVALVPRHKNEVFGEVLAELAVHGRGRPGRPAVDEQQNGLGGRSSLNL